MGASHKDLRREVSEGRFRSDLYYRLAQAEVVVPALRERKEELPWLMQHALSGVPVSLHVSAVEAALLRPWPGNVREQHLAPEAGQPTSTASVVKAPGLPAPSEAAPAAPAARAAVPTKEAVAAALEQSGGNVSGACRILGIAPHNRTQLYRLMKEYGLGREGA